MNLNRLIANLSLGGECDNYGSYEINWKVTDGYVFATIIEYTGRWWYRIFTDQADFKYERGIILDSLDNDGVSGYIYGYYEEMNGTIRELQRWVEPELVALIKMMESDRSEDHVGLANA